MPQIGIIEPRLIVLLGRTASAGLLAEPVKIAEAHGTLRRVGDRSFFITYHPAAAMRFPAIAQAMEADFASLARLAATGPEGPESR